MPQFLIAPSLLVRGFRAARRGGARGDRRRRRSPALRRDGQPLRSQSHGRAARLRGDQAARDGSHRRPSHGETGRSHRRRFCRGRRRHRELPSRSVGTCGPHDRPHPRLRLQGGAGLQSGHPARLARPHARQARPRAHHVGQPGVRRTVVHRRGASQADARALARRGRAAAHGPQDPARSRWRREGRQHRGGGEGRRRHVRRPARRSSARRTIARRSMRCARSSPPCDDEAERGSAGGRADHRRRRDRVRSRRHAARHGARARDRGERAPRRARLSAARAGCRRRADRQGDGESRPPGAGARHRCIARRRRRRSK